MTPTLANLPNVIPSYSVLAREEEEKKTWLLPSTHSFTELVKESEVTFKLQNRRGCLRRNSKRGASTATRKRWFREVWQTKIMVP